MLPGHRVNFVLLTWHLPVAETEWMRPLVPNSNWRESNLDGPPLSSKKVRACACVCLPKCRCLNRKTNCCQIKYLFRFVH